MNFRPVITMMHSGELQKSFCTNRIIRSFLFSMYGDTALSLTGEHTWEQMESFCRKISDHENVWYTTNIDYVNYMNAARNLIFNAECTYVENLSK